MKYLIPILFICGCSTPMPDVALLNKTLHEGNPSYKIEADYKRKTVSISFSNPLLGISGGAGDVWVQGPTNLQLSVMQHQVTMAPEGPKLQSTVNTNKP